MLVAIFVPGVYMHDEGNGAPLIRCRRGYSGSRMRRVVGLEPALGGIARLVYIRVLRRPIALRIDCTRLAGPRLQLRTGEHRAAVWMVGDRELSAGPARQLRCEHGWA